MREGAPCLSVDPELFFPPVYGPSHARQVGAAKALCRRCPGRQPCLTEAMARAEPFGIWGGTTPQERLTMRARRVISAGSS